MTGQCYVDASHSFCDLEGLPSHVGEQVCAGDLARALVEVETAGRPLKDLDIDAVSSSRGAPVPRRNKLRLAFFIFLSSTETSRLVPKESRLRAVNGFAV